MTTSHPTPQHIEVIGNELAIAWDDGSESYIPLEKLRRACPCASCGGEPDLLEPAHAPEKNYRPESFQLQSYQIVGGYAWQPTWGDGHSTGLYSFTLMRKL